MAGALCTACSLVKLEGICCPQPGVTANIPVLPSVRVRRDVAQLWPLGLVSHRRLSQYVYLRMNVRSHRARIVLWAEEIVPSYFKAQGWTTCPRPTGHTDKQGLPKEQDLFQTDAATLKELLSDGKKGDRSISHDLWWINPIVLEVVATACMLPSLMGRVAWCERRNLSAHRCSQSSVYITPLYTYSHKYT